jgi:CHASE2 domain-containing sensor protein
MKGNRKRKGRKKATIATQPPASLEKSRSSGRQILHDFIKGVLLTILMMLVTAVLERTSIGRRVEQYGYDWLQGQLSSERLPLEIVDISELKPAPFNVDGQMGIATPRETLQKLLEAVAEQDARAIGIDIDFSPADSGYITPRDPEFFKFCLDLSERKGIPIFLGIKRTESLAPVRWLGSEDYKSLAASITIPRQDTRKMPKWIRASENSEPGRTMSAALASGFQESQSSMLGWLHEHQLVEQVSEKELKQGVGVGEFPVDYSPLQALIEDKTLRTINPEVIRDQGHRLRGKIVLLGDGMQGSAGDNFDVAGGEQHVPGVYLHACAAYTLSNAPLYELTWPSRLGVDLLLSMLVLLSVIGLRLYFMNRTTRKVAAHRLQVIFTWLVIIAAFVVSVVFVSKTRLMWSDFILVLTGLALHPYLECLFEEKKHKVDKIRGPGLFSSVLFEEEKKEPK